jgi:TRAP-type C4-dicarboxylate transport system permease small subunit
VSRPDAAPPPAAGEPELDIFRLPLDWPRWWTIVPEIVALSCAGLLPLVVGANVLSRYTDWYRILWAEDVVKVLFLWVVFLGGAIAVKYEAHVRMSTLSDRLARTGRAGVLWDRAIRLSPVVMGAILLVLGIRLVEISMRRELPTLQISAGYFSTVVPLSGALMMLYAVRASRTRRTRSPTHPGRRHPIPSAPKAGRCS